MQHVDEARLETDLVYRFEYVAGFMAFDEQDIAAVHATSPHLTPLVPSLVDAIYEKLFSYDATKRHFIPRQHGYEGLVPENIDALSLSHEIIRFRKQHLGRYLERLVTRPYDGEMAQYLDFVGKIHTPKAGSPNLDVPLVQMNAMLGFVADALMTTILGLGLDDETQAGTLRAFNKLLWIQNDLVTRHYAAPPVPA